MLAATSAIRASLTGHMVVKRGDIDADTLGDFAGAQPFQALFDNELARREGDGELAVFPAFAAGKGSLCGSWTTLRRRRGGYTRARNSINHLIERCSGCLAKGAWLGRLLYATGGGIHGL